VISISGEPGFESRCGKLKFCDGICKYLSIMSSNIIIRKTGAGTYSSRVLNLVGYVMFCCVKACVPELVLCVHCTHKIVAVCQRL